MLGAVGGSEGGAEAFFALGVDAWVYCFQVFDCFDEGEALRYGEDAIPFCFLFVNVSEIGMPSMPRSNREMEKMGMGVAHD